MPRKLVLLLLLALAPLTIWGAETEIYDPDVTVSAYRTGLDGGDSAALDTGTTSVSLLRTNGATTVTVSARMSAASATCALTFVRGYLDPDGAFTPQGIQTATASAGSTQTIGGSYAATDVFFDTSGSTHFKVLAADPSSGTVDLWITKSSQ